MDKSRRVSKTPIRSSGQSWNFAEGTRSIQQSAQAAFKFAIMMRIKLLDKPKNY